MSNQGILVVTAAALLMLWPSISAAEQAPVSSKKNQPNDRQTVVERDDFMGDYQGKIRRRDGSESLIVCQVIAQGQGAYRAVLLEAFDQRIPPIAVLAGRMQDSRVAFDRDTSLEGGRFRGKLTGRISGDFDLNRVERESPSLGAKPLREGIVLFDGTNTDQWVGLDKNTAAELPLGWKIAPNGMLTIVPGTGWAMTQKKFLSMRLHVEFRIPLIPTARGQARGNSGVHLQGRYEVQILDSYGLDGVDNECGAIYKVAAPSINMCAPPLQWQTYDIVFHAARYDRQGRKIAAVRISVVHNGVAIHENVEIPGSTAHAPISETPERGPIILQDHGSPVQFRNIWLVELHDNPAGG